MKRMIILIMLFAAQLQAAIQFANINSQVQYETLPDTPNPIWASPDECITNPSPEQCFEYQRQQGLRNVTSIETVRDGWCVTQWIITDTDTTNCTITIAAEYNIAERLALLESYKADLMDNRYNLVWANLDGQRDVTLPELPRPCPNSIGPIFGTPDATQTASYYWSQGWRKILTNAVPDEGNKALGYSIVELDYATCNVIITGQTNIAQEAAEIAAAQAAAAQAAYVADLQANATRYAYENAYIMLCDTLRGDQQHTLIDGLEFAQRTMALKVARPADYDKMRDAFNFIKSQLDPIDLQWGKTAKYRNVPSLVAAAQQMLGLLQ